MDGGLMRPLADDTLTAPLEGDHWFATASRDVLGNVSAVRWFRIRVDGAPPRVSLDVAPPPVAGDDDRLWVRPGAKVAARATDEGAGVAATRLVVGDVHAEGTDDASLPAPGSGTVTVRAWAVDRVENRSDDVAQVVSVDSEPPRGSVRIIGPQVETEGRTFVGPSARAEVVIEDGQSGVARWTPLVGEAEAEEGDWSGPWPPGPRTLGGRAWDRVGHLGVVAARSVFVDRDAPRLSWVLSGAAEVEEAGRKIFRPPVRVEVRADDLDSGMKAVSRLDADSWEPLSADGVIEAAGPSVRLRAEDRVGNVSEADAAFEIDTQPPRIELLIAGAEAAGGDPLRVPIGGQVEVRATDVGSGVSATRYRDCGTGWWAAPPRIRFERAGAHRLELESADRLGNRARASWNILVEKSAGSER